MLFMTMTLFSNRMCPFAQRAVLALEHAGVDSYEVVEVNLYGATGFTKAQLKKVEVGFGKKAKGLVPVLKMGDQLVQESMEVLRVIAEHFPHLQSCGEAKDMEAICDDIAREGKRLVLSGKRRSDELDACLQKLDRVLESSDYLGGGEHLTTVDCCLLPFLMRIDHGGGHFDDDIISAPACANLRAYLDRVQSDSKISNTLPASWWWWW